MFMGSIIVNGQLIMNSCKDHKTEIVCIDCKIKLCINCMIDTKKVHVDHDLISFQKILLVEKENILTMIAQYEDTVSDLTKSINETNLNDKLSDDELLFSFLGQDAYCICHKKPAEAICYKCRECFCLRCLIHGYNPNNKHSHIGHDIYVASEIIPLIREANSWDIACCADKMSITAKKIEECSNLLNRSDETIINQYITNH